jgi:Nucleotidyltransferase of unknown function (DUF6036)
MPASREPIGSVDAANELLQALDQQLGAAGTSFDLVVIGGSALLARGLVDRATQDVDVVALRSRDGLISAVDLPPDLQAAAQRVARDFDVPTDWLNSGPAELLRFGLPDGFEDRWETQRYGAGLTVRWASRFDQIHFKLYAAVDQAGKHLRDLVALQPARNELIAAARWSRKHDPSDGFLSALTEALRYFGVEDADIAN